MKKGGEQRAVLGSDHKKGMWPFLGVGSFLLMWYVVSKVGVVSSLVLPSPQDVLYSINQVGWDLLLHFIATLLRIVIGFAAAAIIGGLVGILMQYNSKVYVILDGIIESWRPVPAVSLVPFFVLIFGFSENGRFLVTVLGTGLVIVVTVFEAISRVDPALIRYGLVCSLNRRRLFSRVILPASVPSMRAGFRVGLALSVTLVVVSEFLGAQYGLGHLISTAKITLNTSVLLLCIFLLGFLGWALDNILRTIFNCMGGWELSAKEALL